MWEKNWKFIFGIILILLILSVSFFHNNQQHLVQQSNQADGWRSVKNVLYNVIYKNHNRTLYEGCRYRDGKIDYSDCKYIPKEDNYKPRAFIVEAEHIVPASLLPARQFPCWETSGRENCEKYDPKAQAMIFDLHNLAPAIGQVNVHRSNLRYGEKPGTFEPVDCVKGDVARIWLYVKLRYGVVFASGEEEMFLRWSKMDPVSPWESMREKRIRDYTFVTNPYVRGQTPDISGACPWD